MKSILGKAFLVCCVSAFSYTLCFGQIFISPDDFPNVTGVTLTYYTNVSQPVQVNVGNSGENQYWNFTEGPDSLQVEEYIIHASESPFAEQFPEANRVRVSDINQYGLPGTVYTHREMSNESLILLGFGAEIFEYPVPIRLGDYGILEYPLPLYYGDDWDNTAVYDTVFRIANPDTTIPLDTVDVMLEATLGDQAEVDAWGEIDGPMGHHQVLRVFHETGLEINVYFWFIVWIPVWDTSFVQIRYEWLAQDYGPVVTIGSTPGETNPNFTEANRILRLMDIYMNIPPAPETQIPLSVALSPNYPNPFNESTAFSFSLPVNSSKNATIAIYNILGQKIITLWQGIPDGNSHQVIWNGNNAQGFPVASGMYFVRLNCGPQMFIQPVMKLD